MDKDLLPCPFCGGSVEFSFGGTGCEDNSMGDISCENKDCAIQPSTGHEVIYDDTWDKQCSEMAKAWNTRATDNPAVDLDALKRDVSDTAVWEKIKTRARHLFNEHRSSPMLVGSDYWLSIATIDYLASRNLIRGAVEPIEGLEEAIEFIKSSNLEAIQISNKIMSKYKRTPENIINEAATKYNEMMKGSK